MRYEATSRGCVSPRMAYNRLDVKPLSDSLVRFMRLWRARRFGDSAFALLVFVGAFLALPFLHQGLGLFPHVAGEPHCHCRHLSSGETNSRAIDDASEARRHDDCPSDREGTCCGICGFVNQYIGLHAFIIPYSIDAHALGDAPISVPNRPVIICSVHGQGPRAPPGFPTA